MFGLKTLRSFLRRWLGIDELTESRSPIDQTLSWQNEQIRNLRGEIGVMGSDKSFERDQGIRNLKAVRENILTQMSESRTRLKSLEERVGGLATLLDKLINSYLHHPALRPKRTKDGKTVLKKKAKTTKRRKN